MARAKLNTLTEQMFYCLLALKEECCGIDIMQKVNEITSGRINIGPGTLYNLLPQFVEAGLIEEVPTNNKKRNYIITKEGLNLLKQEVNRLQTQMNDYYTIINKGENDDRNK